MSKSLVFEYKALKSDVKDKKAILKFTYLSAIHRRALKIKVGGKEIAELNMDEKSHEFISIPIDFDNNTFLVEFTSDAKTHAQFLIPFDCFIQTLCLLEDLSL